MAYVPRLDDNGIVNNFHWYSENPFYLSGYGMPNCTCYSWGRFWEIGDPNNIGEHKPTTLPLSDGGNWWQDNINSGAFNYGQIPELGAVACFEDINGGAGHVAIVEEIDQNGIITCSNSAWQSTFFYLTYLDPANNYSYSHFNFQGFIYNPYAEQPVPPTPVSELKKKRFPWVIYANRIRARNNLTNF